MRLVDIYEITTIDSAISELHQELDNLYRKRESILKTGAVQRTTKAKRHSKQATSLNNIDLSTIDLSLA